MANPLPHYRFSNLIQRVIVFSKTPLAFICALSIAFGISSYFLDRVTDQEGYCITGRMRLYEAIANARGTQDQLHAMRNSSLIIEYSDNATSDALEVAADIRKDIRKLERELALEEKLRFSISKEMEDLCDNIGRARGWSVRLNLIISTILAIYGFWAGTKQSKD